MKYRYAILSVILFAGNAVAGGIGLNKDALRVSPPDPQGVVTIAGPPACVFGAPPIYIMARNKKTGAAVSATALSNGSFSLRIPASGRDTVRLSFVSANGKKKYVTVKVPPGGQGYERGAKRREKHEVNVDLGQFSQFGAPEVGQVKPDGRGGTRVHVGARPTITPLAPTPDVTAAPPPTPSPKPEEALPATPLTEKAAATPPADHHE